MLFVLRVLGSHQFSSACAAVSKHTLQYSQCPLLGTLSVAPSSRWALTLANELRNPSVSSSFTALSPGGFLPPTLRDPWLCECGPSNECPIDALSRPQWGPALRGVSDQTSKAFAYIRREYNDVKG